MSLGSQLKKAREKSKLSQEKLAFDAEIDRTYVSILERDLKSPTIEVLFRLCNALGTTASKILAKVERDNAKSASFKSARNSQK